MKLLSILKPQEIRNLLILFTTGILFWCSFGCLLPILPSYVKEIGGTNQHVGLVMAAYAAGLLIFRPWLGYVADHRSRKLVLLLGTAVAAIVPFGFFLVKSVPLIIAVKLIHALGVGAFSTGFNALVVDLSPVAQRGELIGYMSLTAPLGMAVGPALGGFLEESIGYKSLFIFIGVIAILSFLCVNLAKEYKQEQSVQVPAIQGKATPKNQFWHLLFRPSLLPLTIVLFIIGLNFGVLTVFVPLFIKETVPSLNVGWFYTSAAMASFTARLLTGRASDHYGRGLFITANLISFTGSMVILARAHHSTAFLLAGILEGAGTGTLIPMMLTLISDRSYPHERGQAFSLCMAGFDLGMAIAGPLFGAITEITGFRGIFVVCSGLGILALIMFITHSSKNLSHSLRFALGQDRDAYAVGN